MDDWSRGKTAVAVAALAVAFAAPAVLSGIAFAVDHADGDAQADIDSRPKVQCSWLVAEHANVGARTGDQVCYVENAANVEGEGSASY